MNIFVLDTDPVVAAQLQCDKHVVKMIVESAQMLSTVHRMLDGTMERRRSKSGKMMLKYWAHPDHGMEANLYKAVHTGHPCTVWSLESSANYYWHLNHFEALLNEYEYRYNKKHSSGRLMRYLLNPPINIPSGGITPFKLAMGSNPECIDNNDPVGSYRKFYQTKQERFKMAWTARKIPDWFNVTATA